MTLVEDAYRRHRAEALATLIRLVGDFDLAEEGLQEAFAAAPAAWAKAPPANPRAWLIQVGRRKALDQLRRRAAFRTRRDALEAEARDRTGRPAGRDRRGRGGVRRRRPAAADLHLLPPGAEPGSAGGADLADGLLAADPGRGPRLPRARGDHGPAAGAGEGQDPLRRHPLPHPAAGAAGRAHRRRAGGALPGVHRGLRRRSAPEPGRGGDRARPAAERPAARARGDHGPPGADAAARGPPAGADRCGGRHRAAWKTRTGTSGTASTIAEGLALVEPALRAETPPSTYAVQAAIAALHDSARRAAGHRLAPDRRPLCGADAPVSPRR